jgi:Family of unknown function (DUF5990)
MATTRTPAPEILIRVVVERPVPGVLLRLRRGASELVEPTSSSSSEVAFDFTVRVGPARAGGALNLLGPFTHGPPDDRFIYVNAGRQAGQVETPWDRRAKVPLTAITQALVDAVLANPGARLEVRIPGTGRDGGPTCASVRLPPGAWQLIPGSSAGRRHRGAV